MYGWLQARTVNLKLIRSEKGNTGLFHWRDLTGITA